ncbi:phage major capsid protein [Pectinatus frisingensis]|uniref:phage major capsid protein n=1 Tax=Pectinatus frisingensis TaxID=865 RepID=UPI0018C75EB9|nr:phage major capsid protein [Pectinatus frisingensis]
MDKILAMREKRAKAWEDTKAFLDTHTDAEGKLSAEDAAAYDKMEAEVVALGKDIERLERQAVLDAKLSQATTAPITNQPGEKAKTGRASDAYKEAMLKALRTNFRQVENVLQEGIDAQGGYLVPEEYDRRLIDVLIEENIMRSLATHITTSGEHKINIAATKPAASWIEEGGALSFGEATFDQIIMDAHKLHVAIKVTEELLYDNAFNLESYIIDQFGKAIGNAEEDAFLNGDGKSKPLGLFPSATVGVTTSTVSVTADDIINLIYALKRPYRKSASFITNDQTLAVIRKLKDNNGAYLWQPSYQAGEPDRILGYAIHTSAYVPTIAAGQAVMSFGDYSYYNIGDRGSRSLQELKELFAGNGMIGYVMKERVDGKLILPEAVQLLRMKGTAGA